jgi:hypothetical protein
MLAESDIADFLGIAYPEQTFDGLIIWRLFLDHFDGDFRTVGLGEPGLIVQAGWYRAVTTLMGVAKFIEIEQFRCQRLAARVSLTPLPVDANFELSGHCKRFPSRAFFAAHCVPQISLMLQANWPHDAIISYYIRAALALSRKGVKTDRSDDRGSVANIL